MPKAQNTFHSAGWSVDISLINSCWSEDIFCLAEEQSFSHKDFYQDFYQISTANTVQMHTEVHGRVHSSIFSYTALRPYLECIQTWLHVA